MIFRGQSKYILPITTLFNLDLELLLKFSFVPSLRYTHQVSPGIFNFRERNNFYFVPLNESCARTQPHTKYDYKLQPSMCIYSKS